MIEITVAVAFLMVSGFLIGAGIFVLLLGAIAYLWGKDGN